ncbi:MAG: hypothetical protein ACYC5Y_04140 [Symbiobacteriia bacterium]
MSTSTMATLQFHLRKDWTLRKVVTALVREWLPPFRAAPPAKGIRWSVQRVVEVPGGAETDLWERGISTPEYEARLDRPEVSWSIRARNGRGKGVILAHLAMSADQPETVTMELCLDPFPDALFDAEKLEEFLEAPTSLEMGALCAALLTKHGFAPTAA